MEGFNQQSRFEAGELRRASEAFDKAFTSKCKEVFGTDTGTSFSLSGNPPRARLRKEEPSGGLASPETWEKVKAIGTEIARTYELEEAGLEMIFEIDPNEGPTIIIQHKEA